MPIPPACNFLANSRGYGDVFDSTDTVHDKEGNSCVRPVYVILGLVLKSSGRVEAPWRNLKIF